MKNHQCEAIVITCIDFRFQEYINNWLLENFESGTFDRVAYAGGVKDLDTILGQIGTSAQLHHIQRAVLINHEDCGAYGAEGTYENHVKDLKNASSEIKKQFPNLNVEIYYLHLDGTFEKIQ